jgi:hypothetical protein
MKIAVVLLAFLLSGCATFKALKGGAANIVFSKDKTEATVSQSENPADKAEQSSTRKESRETPVPVPVTKVTETTTPDGTKIVTTESFSTAVSKESIDQSAQTKVGPAQKDTARELAAKLASMRPIQYVGIGCLLFAAAGLFYAPLRIILGGGKQFPLAIGLLGAGLVVAPQLIAGNETLILIGSAVAGFIYWMSIRLTRKEAEADLKKLP